MTLTAHDTESELEQCLLRFRIVAHEVQVVLRGLNSYPDAAAALNEDVLFGLTQYSILLVTKYLEVFDDFGALAKRVPRVVDVRRAIAPFVDRIKVWPALRQHRDRAVAHAYIDKAGRLAPPWTLQHLEQAPSFHAEVLLLLNLVTLATLVTLSCFSAEFYRVTDQLALPQPTPGPGPGISHGQEIDAELHRLRLLVQDRMEIHRIAVDKGLVDAFRQAITPPSAA